MCVASVSVLRVTWNTIGMLTLKLETLHAINAHRNSNRPIFCEHIETPCIQMCLNMNAKNVAANSNEIITWWYDILNNIMIYVWFFYYNLLSSSCFVHFSCQKQAHRRTHNKEPRKPRRKKTEKASSSPNYEVVEMIKNEEIDIEELEDGTYETEFIAV